MIPFYLVDSLFDLALFIVWSAFAIVGIIAVVDEYLEERKK